jgi:hypothetical protein
VCTLTRQLFISFYSLFLHGRVADARGGEAAVLDGRL